MFRCLFCVCLDVYFALKLQLVNSVDAKLRKSCGVDFDRIMKIKTLEINHPIFYYCEAVTIYL